MFVDAFSFLATTTQHNVTDGDVALFRCSSPCTERLRGITWYNGTGELTIDNGKYFLSADNTLHITSITQSDAGAYICRTSAEIIAEHTLTVEAPKESATTPVPVETSMDADGTSEPIGTTKKAEGSSEPDKPTKMSDPTMSDPPKTSERDDSAIETMAAQLAGAMVLVMAGGMFIFITVISQSAKTQSQIVN